MATPPIKTPTCIFLSLHSKPIVPSMELQFHGHKPRSRNKFVGVRQRASGKWVAEIKNTTQKIRMWLGTFDTAEEAARAYDEAACLLHGSNARTNFFNSGPCKPELSLKIRNLLNQKRGLNKATQPPSPSSNTNTGKFSIQESTGGNITLNTVYLMDAYKPDLSCYIGGYDQMYSSSPHFIYSCQDSMDPDENINVQKDGIYARKREGEVMNEVQLPDFERMEGEKEISSKSLNANECNDPLWDILTLYQMFCQS